MRRKGTSPPLIAAVVSLLGVFASAASVWTAYISKAKEIASAQLSNERESRRLEAEHEKDWNLQVTRFVYENRKDIFSGSKEDREQIAALMKATFPPDVYNNVFGKLAAGTTDTEAREVWRQSQSILPSPTQVQEALAPRVRAEPIPNTKSYKFLLWLDLSDAQKGNIARVEYNFDHPSFRNKVLASSDSAHGFPVSYVGWGAIDSVHITAITRGGGVEKAELDMISALGW